MAEKLCGLRKKGGGNLKETVLWTNNAPTSNFTAQNIALSDNLTNYKYLKCVYSISAATDVRGSIIVDGSEFKAMGMGADKIAYTLMANASPIYLVLRRQMYYASDTQIAFTEGSLLNYGNNTITTAQNQVNIPLQIIGLK
jgi:hypothetical protein